MNVTCVADTKCVLGEGPVWDERAQLLYWVDIKAPAINPLQGKNQLGRFPCKTFKATLGILNLGYSHHAHERIKDATHHMPIAWFVMAYSAGHFAAGNRNIKAAGGQGRW